MINKKIVFSMFTVPFAIFCHDNGEWQRRRKLEKENEIKRRTENLTKEALDISPVDGKFCFRGKSADEIEKEYGFKKVKVRGIIDFEKQALIDSVENGERGYYVINPLYTHVNENKEPCGILVNRGFLPNDYLLTREHHLAQKDGYFEGILYCGDNLTKYDDKPNNAWEETFTKAIPKELSLVLGLKNREDSGLAMLKLVEFDEDHQTVMPSAPTIGDLTRWKNSPERHGAYEKFWKYTTYFNLFANTMFWLYF